MVKAKKTTEQAAGDQVAAEQITEAQEAPAEQAAGDQVAAEQITEAQEAPAEQAAGDIEGLWIESLSEHGRIRAGIKWMREGAGVALSALTDEQIIALKNDPMLRVTEATFPANEVAKQ